MLPPQAYLTHLSRAILGVFLVGLTFFGLRMLNSGEKQSSISDNVVYSTPVQILHNSNPGASSGRMGWETKPSGSPEAVLSASFYDFGAIEPDETVSEIFEVRNRGTTDLEIADGYTTCGCTSAELSTARIPPGKAALLTVRFDPAFHQLRKATVRRGLILHTNDPAHPVLEIWVQATIR